MTLTKVLKKARTEINQRSTNFKELSTNALEGLTYQNLGISIYNDNPFRVRGNSIYHAGTVIPLGSFEKISDNEVKFIINYDMYEGTELEQKLILECTKLAEHYSYLLSIV